MVTYKVQLRPCDIFLIKCCITKAKSLSCTKFILGLSRLMRYVFSTTMISKNIIIHSSPVCNSILPPSPSPSFLTCVIVILSGVDEGSKWDNKMHRFRNHNSMVLFNSESLSLLLSHRCWHGIKYSSRSQRFPAQSEWHWAVVTAAAGEGEAHDRLDGMLRKRSKLQLGG